MNLSKKYTYRILIVEDNYEEAFLIEDLLDIPGYKFHFTHFTSILKATEVLKFGTFDVAILDLGLPECSNKKRLDKFFLENRLLPVLTLGPNQNASNNQLPPYCKSTEMLVKGSFTGKELFHAIRNIISGKMKDSIHLAE